jgi:UDP-N-acetyl-D-galactosamine dehydrogenase
MEIANEYLLKAINNGLFSSTSNLKDSITCEVYIVTVITPTDRYNRPLINPLNKVLKN